MYNKDQLIEALSKEIDTVKVADEVLDKLAEEYLNLKGQIRFTFEQYVKIQLVDHKVKQFPIMR